MNGDEFNRRLRWRRLRQQLAAQAGQNSSPLLLPLRVLKLALAILRPTRAPCCTR